jgi:hypothetical protein
VVTGKVVPVADVGGTFKPDTNGTIDTMHPDLRFEVQINAGPGYSPEPWTTHFTPEKGKRVKVDLAKDVKFTKKADSFS